MDPMVMGGRIAVVVMLFCLILVTILGVLDLPFPPIEKWHAVLFCLGIYAFSLWIRRRRGEKGDGESASKAGSE